MPTLRQLGTSDLHLTPVGLGTWAMGGGDWKASWGPQDDADSVATIHAALDGGINWIDTAPAYGLGHAETIVGRALKERAEAGHDRPIVATKCGRVWPEGVRDQLNGNLTAKSVKTECESSLKRLGLETIDLYQIHWPDPDDQIEEAWRAIAELKQAGKIRHAGVSNFSVEQIQRVQQAAPDLPVVSLQPQYNLVQRQIEHDVLPFCQENNIGVVGYSTLAKGLLTGKVTKAWVENLPDDDHRKRDPLYQPERLDALEVPLEKFAEQARNLGLTPTQLAVVWSATQPGVTSAIAGARRPDQIEPVAAVTAAPAGVAADALAALADLFPASIEAPRPTR